jgi:hypothetical protein
MNRFVFLNGYCASALVKLGFRSDLLNSLEVKRRRTRNQNVVIVFIHRLDDPSNLFHGLSAAKDDLGEALAKCAVMINVCKAQIFER